jgi:hypothetical protein
MQGRLTRSTRRVASRLKVRHPRWQDSSACFRANSADLCGASHSAAIPQGCGWCPRGSHVREGCRAQTRCRFRGRRGGYHHGADRFCDPKFEGFRTAPEVGRWWQHVPIRVARWRKALAGQLSLPEKTEGALTRFDVQARSCIWTIRLLLTRTLRCAHRPQLGAENPVRLSKKCH